ncbi:Prolyl endopeptidase, partial [Pseudolycoriella hygida]
MLPQFKLIYLLFIELFNAIVVIIYIRGGGELGDDWLLKSSEMETSFSDLIVGVEYLKSKAYKDLIDARKIAFLGISHGGVAGSVAINKRRDLFRAVIFQNANVDLIHDLPTKGHLWAKQYGNLNKKEDYDNIKRYAPLLHITEPKSPEDAYPITLVVASRYDEVVDFANSLKYVALRRAHSNKSIQKDKPILLKVINSGGHHYESAEKRELFDTIFAKLEFLAQAMDLKFDTKYQ